VDRLTGIEEYLMKRILPRLPIAAAGCGLLLWLLGLGGQPAQRAGCLRAAWAAEGVPREEGDNSRCLCCHMYLDGEELVVKHLAQKITCRSCHGPSEPHRQDETLRTKPDLLYGRAQVAAFCRRCHEQHKDAGLVEEFRQKWLGRTRPNGRFIHPDAVCTDCHGEHTVPPRK
jgi:hypothetical protein